VITPVRLESFYIIKINYNIFIFIFIFIDMQVTSSHKKVLVVKVTELDGDQLPNLNETGFVF
jgi:hypothetical protein